MKFLTIFITFAALCFAQTDIYVTSLAGNNVTVVDPYSFTITAQIIVPQGPTGIVTTPTGEVYVASQGAHVVSVISTATKSIIATIPVCHTPTQVSLSPDYAQLLVSCQGSNAVAAIDTASKRVIATIEVGNRPGHVGFVGNFAFVPNLWDNTVNVIELWNHTIVNTFSTDSGPSAMATSSRHVYIANQYSNTISVHNWDGTRVGTITGFSSPNSIAIVENRGYVTNGNSSSFTMFDTDSNAIISHTPVGSIPMYSARSADGKRDYVINLFGFSLTAIDTSNGRVVNTLYPVCVYPTAVAVAYF